MVGQEVLGAGSGLEVRMPITATIRRATSVAAGVILAMQVSQQPSVGAGVDASAGTAPYLVISIQNLSPAGPRGGGRPVIIGAAP